MNNYISALANTLTQENRTLTENGASTLQSSGGACVDLFGTIGALRNQMDEDICKRFQKAYYENPDLAMKILFYARDIRGGLGERKVFRTILGWLAEHFPMSVLKNLENIAEYGRFDDILCLIDTKCEDAALKYLYSVFEKDLMILKKDGEDADITLLGKWLPSANTSSKETVRLARRICKAWGLKERTYRRALTVLRKQIRIIENYLRTKDYSFDYSKQPSRAMLKYRKAFIRHDGERYEEYLNDVKEGKATLHTGTLYPYDIVHKVLDCRYGRYNSMLAEERNSLDVTWNALEDFTDGRNAMCVIDGSGSMYSGENVAPIDVAISLGLYFAERNKGAFKNSFITFSTNPRLVRVPEVGDIIDKVQYVASYNECANTNIQRTFELLLKAAVDGHIPQEEMPETLYIISDMEFDYCTYNAEMTNFEYAKKIYEEAGYHLPNLVFWNVDSRHEQQPVSKNQLGVALVSGMSPSVFKMAMSGEIDPEKFMMSVIGSERYARIVA